MTRWWIAAAVVAFATAAAEVVWHDASHAYSWWHEVPAFDLAFGFLGCVAIVVLSKALGRWWLQRPEGYWERER